MISFFERRRRKAGGGRAGAGRSSSPDPLLDVLQEDTADIRAAVFLQGLELALDDSLTQLLVPNDDVDEGGDAQRVLLPEEHTSPVHGLSDGAGVEPDDRNLPVDRLQAWNAEPLVLAEADIDVGQLEEGHELPAVDMTAEMPRPEPTP